MKNICYFFIIFLILPIKLFAIENIKIAYYGNFHPFSFYKDDKLKGIFVESMEELFKNSKSIKVSSEGFPWERAQDLVRKNEYDSIITLTTPDREKYLFHTKHTVIEDKLVLVYLSNNPNANAIKKIKEKEELKKYVINEYVGNGLNKSIYSENDGYKLDYSANLETCFLKLASGRGDIIITNKANANVYISQLHGKKLKYIDALFVKNHLKYYFFLRKTYPNAEKIIKYVDSVLENKSSQLIINKIYKKYISDDKIKIDNFNNKLK